MPRGLPEAKGHDQQRCHDSICVTRQQPDDRNNDGREHREPPEEGDHRLPLAEGCLVVVLQRLTMLILGSALPALLVGGR